MVGDILLRWPDAELMLTLRSLPTPSAVVLTALRQGRRTFCAAWAALELAHPVRRLGGSSLMRGPPIQAP